MTCALQPAGLLPASAPTSESTSLGLLNGNYLAPQPASHHGARDTRLQGTAAGRLALQSLGAHRAPSCYTLPLRLGLSHCAGPDPLGRGTRNTATGLGFIQSMLFEHETEEFFLVSGSLRLRNGAQGPYIFGSTRFLTLTTASSVQSERRVLHGWSYGVVHRTHL